MDFKGLLPPDVYFRFRSMTGKVVVTCAFVCLSACGPKKGVTDNYDL